MEAAGRPSKKNIEAAIDRLKVLGPENRRRAMEPLTAAGSIMPMPDDIDRTISWAQAVEMDTRGVVFGAHTQTHEVLTAVPENAARLEIAGSKVELERMLHKRCSLFAYPNGDHSIGTRRLVAEAGFTKAFTTARGAWTAASDLFAIPRPNVSEDDLAGPTGQFSAAMFEYNVFWKASRALRAKSA
jgi:peptidoglycan/xylan/chitin deacetylase (PgdA/CDA1 family)